MPKKRSKIAISTEILRTIFDKGRARPTHIQYAANLSYRRLSGYLDELISQELVERKTINGKTFFVVTERGKEFLIGVQKIKEFSRSFGIEI